MRDRENTLFSLQELYTFRIFCSQAPKYLERSCDAPCIRVSPVSEGRSRATVGKPRVSKGFWWLLDPKKYEETTDGKLSLIHI